MAVLKDIDLRVRQARKNKQLIQAELVELMNDSTPYVSDIENGKINYKNMMKILLLSDKILLRNRKDLIS